MKSESYKYQDLIGAVLLIGTVKPRLRIKFRFDGIYLLPLNEAANLIPSSLRFIAQ